LETVNASGISPWYGIHCNPQGIPSTPNALGNAETDIAVNPRNRLNEVAAWIDTYEGNMDTAYTNDGGRHWYRSIPMGLNNCSGGSDPAAEGSADPSVAFGPDGTAYFASLTWRNGYLPPTSDYTEWTDVQTSTDGGATWSAPAIVRQPAECCIDDRDDMVVDPQRPGYVYVSFVNDAGKGLPNQILFNRSTDGGKTFTTTVMPVSGGAPQMGVFANGTLLFQYGNNEEYSTDAGSTWSSPVSVRPPLSPGNHNPGPICGVGLDGAGDGGNHVAISDDTAYVVRVYNGATGRGPATVQLSKTTNAGQSWTTFTAFTTPLPIWMAEVATNKWGQVGVAYYNYDPASATCSPEVLPATTYMRVSDDGGNSWSHPVVLGAKSWNLASGGTGNWNADTWLGEYFGLAGTQTGFAASTVQGATITNGAHTPAITGLNSIVGSQVQTSH
jgi:hypothetical protein